MNEEHPNWNADEYFQHKAFFEELLDRVAPRDCSAEEADAWVNALEDRLDDWI